MKSRGAPCALLRSPCNYCTNDGSWARTVSWIWSQVHGTLSTEGVCLLVLPFVQPVLDFATWHRLVSDAYVDQTQVAR